jgi:hypothetical protein
MREILTCDFCGDEAAGTFEAVPPERDPAGEGRRVVLCPDCRDTLASVLEPLLSEGGAAEHARRAEGSTSTSTVVAEPDREADADATTGTERTVDTGTPTDIATALEGEDRDEASANPDPDSTPDPSSDGTTPARSGGAGTDANATGGQRGSNRRGAPRGYRKVMRFLENREFPMDREEAETLVTEAYGMDPGSVSAAIDHAIKHNRLREANGDLLR